MTIYQILAIAICGPLALASLAQLLGVFLLKRKKWGIPEAALLVISIVVIVVSFIGIQWPT